MFAVAKAANQDRGKARETQDQNPAAAGREGKMHWTSSMNGPASNHLTTPIVSTKIEPARYRQLTEIDRAAAN